MKEKVRRLLAERHAILMAHYYTRPEVQEVADFVGDSLALAQQAAKTDAEVIVMAGVHFMAETCKILCPGKTVLCPDMNAGCSLADSCRAEDLKTWRDAHPGYKVISYVNTTAAVKALTDIVVTSGNALKIVNQMPKDEKILFGPDKNLGAYINTQTGRKMELWNGGCHVHERFTAKEIMRLKKLHPEAEVLVHPECPADVVALADTAGSTAVLLRHAQESDCKQFIVVTESGILHEMQRTCKGKVFLPVSLPNGSCNECEHMKLNTLKKIIDCLETLQPQVTVEEDVAREAVKPIKRMMELS